MIIKIKQSILQSHLVFNKSELNGKKIGYRVIIYDSKKMPIKIDTAG